MVSLSSEIYVNQVASYELTNKPLGELRGRSCTVFDSSYLQKEKCVAGEDSALPCVVVVMAVAALLFLGAIALITVGAVLSMPICLLSGVIVAGFIIMVAIKLCRP